MISDYLRESNRTRQMLKTALNRSREELPGISLREIADAIAEALEEHEIRHLIVSLNIVRDNARKPRSVRWYCPEGICDGSGWVSSDEDDGEGHSQQGVESRPCVCRSRASAE